MKKLNCAVLAVCVGACGGNNSLLPDAPPEPLDADQRGIVYSGQLFPWTIEDRVFVWKADHPRGLCTTLVLVRPDGSTPAFSVATPSGWGVEGGRVSTDADMCGPDTSRMQQWATGGTGTVTFVTTMPSGNPCVVDVDVSLTFPSSMPWVPASGDVQVTGLEVATGC